MTDVYQGNDATLEFSIDTVMFDTVFTSFGTTTKNIRIYNTYQEKLNISKIELARGTSSAYRINVDGVSGVYFENIEILPQDSIFIFIEATIDPTNSNSPLIVQDSILFETNGNNQDIDLIAWGQDIHLLNGEYIEETIWTADKPYVIYNSAAIDENHTLTIEAGAKIYFHKNSNLYVLGTLIVNGEYENPVIFKSDRLESFYEDIPDQWGYIHFVSGSRDNKINWAEISQGKMGIIVDTTMNNNPTLEISNTKISHVLLGGLLGRGSKIRGNNILITNCGQSCLALIYGGDYEFYHSTFANYYRGVRAFPSVLLNNYFVVDGTLYARDLSNAYFGNCIIYGNNEEELVLDYSIDELVVPALFNFIFDNSIIKTNDELFQEWSNTNRFENCILDDPKFISSREYNFMLDTLSPAKDYGKLEWGQQFPFDLNNNSRIIDLGPDVGAYERIETETLN